MPVDCDMLHGVVRGDDLYFAKKMFQFALEYSGMQVLKKLCMNEAVQDFGRLRYNDSSFASYEVHSIVFLIARRQISGSLCGLRVLNQSDSPMSRQGNNLPLLAVLPLIRSIYI